MKAAIGLLLLLSGCARSSSDKATIAAQQKTYEISFESEKLESSQTPQGVGEAYRLKASGLPIGQKFILFGKNLNQQEMVLNYFFVDSQGQLMAYDEEKGSYSLSDILFKKGVFAKGEPYEYLLVSEDGRCRATTQIIPNPVKLVSPQGVEISLVRTSLDGKDWLAQGLGFHPHETVQVIAKSGRRFVNKELKANARGEIALALETALSGQAGGKALLTLKTEREELSLEYPWGTEALEKQK